MRRSFLLISLVVLTVSLLCSAVPVRAEDRIRISTVTMTDNPFDPRSGQTITITGTITEFAGENEMKAPVVTALVAERVEVPVTLSGGAVTELAAEPFQAMAEWQFSFAWDGVIPWDLFAQGTFPCVITAVSSMNPNRTAARMVRLTVQSARAEIQH